MRKGQTIKSQAISMIERLSTQEIKNSAISMMLNKALRIRRLLEIASNNLNIVDVFSDLELSFFPAKKIGVVNFEKWLELIRTNKLVTFEEGKQLYKDFKAETKRKR